MQLASLFLEGMMKKLVSELSGAELDYWIGLSEGLTVFISNLNYCIVDYDKGGKWMYSPSTDPEQGCPIIEREKIGCLFNEKEQCWFASRPKERITIQEGETFLIAAMRCRVASVYGEYVSDDD